MRGVITSSRHPMIATISNTCRPARVPEPVNRTATTLLAFSALVLALPRGATARTELRVMTYNVNFGLVGNSATTRAMTEQNPDVVFLQETNPAWERRIRRRLSRRFPHMGFHHCCRAGGLAVLSKYPIEQSEVLDPPTGWFPAWRVVVRAPIGPVQVLNVHLHPPVTDSGSWLIGYFTTGPHRLRELKHYLSRLKSGLPTVILGDFNEPRGPALDLLWARGMRDALAEHAPGKATWRWQTAFGRVTQVLDHVFYGPRLATVGAKVLDAGRSDHLPVIVRLVRASPPAAAGSKSL